MPVYLDHAATTPVRPEVIALYGEELGRIGNPSSVHKFGQDARTIVEEAREALAEAIDANRSEIIFTSGGTEANNLAIKGFYWLRNQQDPNRNVVISAQTEHHAVLDAVEWLETHEGAELVFVPVNRDGIIDLDYLKHYLEANHERVALISLMWVNNETGVITDIKSVTEIAKPFGIPVHSDAVAAVGHIPISFKKSGLAAMTITGHKIGAPVGTGALALSRDANLMSLFHGGGQERGVRSGTLNAAGAKALALAAQLSVQELEQKTETWAAFKNQIKDFLKANPELKGHITGDHQQSSPNIIHLVFDGCAGDSLLFVFDTSGIAVSNGSACTAGVTSASHVLLAMGFDEQHSSGGVRVSCGYNTTKADIDAFLEVLPKAVESARKAGFVHAQLS